MEQFQVVPLDDDSADNLGFDEEWAADGSPVVTSEIEVKFALDANQVLPDLGAVATVGAGAEFELNALYFDTPDCAITASGGSLRRRSGGMDAGWHLKLTTSDSRQRTELRAPITSARPPAMLREALGPLQFSPLLPIARLHTIRREIPLIDEHRVTLALVCVDQVWAEVPASIHGDFLADAKPTWREIEVELVDGDDAFLGAVSTALMRAGLVPARYGSKIAHALEVAGWGTTEADSISSSAWSAISSYAATQIGVIQSLEEGVRTDAPEAVHKSRVASRRLRSTLRTFSPFFPPELVHQLVSDLRWYGQALGDARDAEVLTTHLDDAMMDVGMHDAVVADELRRWNATAQREALKVAVDSLDTLRFEMFQDALVDLLVTCQDSGLTHTDAQAAAMMAIATARAARRYLHALDLSTDESSPVVHAEAHLDAWHEVRKAAKAVRYGFEAIAAHAGAGAYSRAEAWEAVTGSLGLVQDSVVAQAAVRRFAERRDAVAGHDDIEALLARERRLTHREIAEAHGTIAAALELAVAEACG